MTKVPRTCRGEPQLRPDLITAKNRFTASRAKRSRRRCRNMVLNWRSGTPRGRNDTTLSLQCTTGETVATLTSPSRSRALCVGALPIGARMLFDDDAHLAQGCCCGHHRLRRHGRALVREGQALGGRAANAGQGERRHGTCGEQDRPFRRSQGLDGGGPGVRGGQRECTYKRAIVCSHSHRNAPLCRISTPDAAEERIIAPVGPCVDVYSSSEERGHLEPCAWLVTVCFASCTSLVPSTASFRDLSHAPRSQNLTFIETSAKDGTNVAQLFDVVATKIPKAAPQQQQQGRGLNLQQDQGQGGMSCCS